MTDLVQEIAQEIAEARAAAARQSVGVIREIGDGVARVEGLADVMLNEMLDFGRGTTGLALNLDETEVGVIVLGDYTQLQRRGSRDRAAAAGPGRQGAARTRGERSANHSTARVRLTPSRAIRSRSWLPASSDAGRWGSRCRPASWPSTR